MSDVTIDYRGLKVSGYLSEPDVDLFPQARAGLVVIQEWWGLTDDIREIADRYATEGYLAFAPDLLASGNKVACLVRVAKSMSSGEGPTVEQILGAMTNLGMTYSKQPVKLFLSDRAKQAVKNFLAVGTIW